jgi:hypothetical protein
MPDAPVDARGVDPDEHIVIPRLRLVDVLELQDIGGTILVLNDRLDSAPR